MKHKTTVKRGADPEFADLYGGEYVASCACGWSEQRSSQERAERSAIVHRADTAQDEDGDD